MLGTISEIIKISRYLSNQRKRQLLFTLIFMLLSGLSELLLINTFQPFLAVITDKKLLSNFGFSKMISKVLNIPLDGEAIFPFILLFAISVIIATAFRLLSTW